jgi:ADP-ribose pyrophosphatase
MGTMRSAAMDRHPEVVKRQRIFEGRKVALEVHHIRAPDGRQTTREIVCHRGSVAILAFPEPGRVLLERVWRYALGAAMYEIPAGTLEPGEAPAACAARELAEETGYTAGRLEPLLAVHPSPGILTERLTVYLASDVRPGRPAREPGEEIENVLVPLDEALAMIRDGRISDAKTVAAILFWDRFRRGTG